jgi:RHS repeat-associated protein
VPKTPEVFTYDLDGNLTSDGRFTYTWDAENRLVSVEALANLPAAAKAKAQYSYDGFSRRISKKAWRWIDAGSGSQPSAVFVKEDAVTLGDWNAPYAGYGSQGDRLIGGHAVADTVSHPSYATVTTSGAFAYTWAATTTESRALHHGAQRVAGCWASNTNFTIQVNITDGLPHRVGFYCLDWDGAQTRQQEIEVRDAVTHALLDRQTVREFSNGRYLFWNITGNVKFVFVNTGAINAVVSGLFFDPATTGYQPSIDQRYLYDGWNLLAEQDYNPVSNSYVPGQRYTWGLDLSGTMQGAGGVSGLLAIHPTSGTSSSSFVPAYDGNGNLTTLIRTTDRTVAAEYEYGPFGEALRATGAMANANPFRFSTKYCDEETGLVYYGYRYYQPQTGRWLSRDRIGERGGLNLYGFTDNRPINTYDLNGLITPDRQEELNAPQIQVTVVSKDPGDCGAFSVTLRLELDRPAPADGFVVAYHDRKAHEIPCAGGNPKPYLEFPYYESFEVTAGQRQLKETNLVARGVTDFWATDASAVPCKKGTEDIKAKWKFLPKGLTGDLGGFSRPGQWPLLLAPDNELPVSQQPPQGWGLYGPSAELSLHAEFDCCQSKQKTTLTVK